MTAFTNRDTRAWFRSTCSRCSRHWSRPPYCSHCRSWTCRSCLGTWTWSGRRGDQPPASHSHRSPVLGEWSILVTIRKVIHLKCFVQYRRLLASCSIDGNVNGMGCVWDVIYGFDRRLKFYNCLVFLTRTDGRRVEIPATPGAVDPVLAHEAVATVTGKPAHNKTRWILLMKSRGPFWKYWFCRFKVTCKSF